MFLSTDWTLQYVSLFKLCCHLMFLSMGLYSMQHFFYIMPPSGVLEHGVEFYVAIITLCHHVMFLDTKQDSTSYYLYCGARWCSLELATYIVPLFCDGLNNRVEFYVALALCFHVMFLSTDFDSVGNYLNCVAMGFFEGAMGLYVVLLALCWHVMFSSMGLDSTQHNCVIYVAILSTGLDYK
jgi:hypothetical protein